MFSRFTRTAVVRAALALAATNALPGDAAAGDRDNHRFGTDRGLRYDPRARESDRGDDNRSRGHSNDDRHRDHDRPRGHVNIEIRSGGYAPSPPGYEERVWVEPVYRTVVDRRWVEPVYRTAVDRVWVEPAVEKVNDRVWVPDRYEWRETVSYHCGQRLVRRELVLVERAHYENVCRDVVVSAGYYKDCPREELVCAGRWETCERQELVCAGHFETRTVSRPVTVVHASIGGPLPRPPLRPPLPPLPPLPRLPF